MFQALAFEKQKQVQPLHNLEAEQSLLGALMLNNQTFEDVSEFLKAEHFYHPVHKKIYGHMATLITRSQVADPITLKPLLENDASIQEMKEGVGYLVDLVSGIISTVCVRDYGQMIHEFYLRRSLASIGDIIVRDAHEVNSQDTAMEKIEGAEKQLYDLASSGSTSRGALPLNSVLQKTLEMAQIAYRCEGATVGVTTGILQIDQWLGGLRPGNLIILAGRPGMGKTVLGTNIAFNAAKAFADNPDGRGAKAAYFSLEMTAEELGTRLLSTASKISSDKIFRGDIKATDFPGLVQASRSIENLGLFIDDTAGLTVTAIRNRARRLQRQHGIGLIVVDHLQIIGNADVKYGGGSKVQQVSDISQALKALAKELNVPVIALSQLSREVEKREDKRPHLSDLRESGSIEQDADVVMFLYREAYYESRKEPGLGTEAHKVWQQKMNSILKKSEVNIEKNRSGPRGIINLDFDAKINLFKDSTNGNGG